MSLSKPDWAPYTEDWPSGIKEWWPAELAPAGHFGVIDGGPLAERYRVHCRTMLRGLEMRRPGCCGMGLQITLPPAGRYKPEAARLTLLHAPDCARGGAS